MGERWIVVAGMARRVLWWLAAMLVAFQLVVALTGREDSFVADNPARVEVQETQRLEILRVRPKKPRPGGHLVLDLSGGAEALEHLRVRLGVHELPAVSTENGQHVFALPPKLPVGEYALRLATPQEPGPRRYIQVAVPSQRKLLRNILGGLGLVLFGMHLVARAIRRFGGHELRRLLGQSPARTPRVLGVAMVTGAVGQMATTTGSMVVSLLRHRLLTQSAALAFWVWAQLGAACTGASLPLLPVREALLVVALGVFWLLLAVERRARAWARFVLGVGLLLQGVQLLRVGFGALGDVPTLSSIGVGLAPGGVVELLMACVLGVLLGVLLQGPGPVCVLVVGFMQSTASISMSAALGVALGSWLGNAVVGYVGSLRYPAESRRAAGLHVLSAAVFVVLGLLLVSPALQAVEVLIGTDPLLRVYGKKIALPHASLHFAMAYVGLQALLVLACAGVWSVLEIRGQSPIADGSARSSLEDSAQPRADQSSASERVELLTVLRGQARVAEVCTLQLLQAPSRDMANIASLLADCEGPMHQLMVDCSDRDEPGDAEVSGLVEAAVIVEEPARLAQVVMVLVIQHQALVHLSHSIERWQASGGRLREHDRQTIESMHTLVASGFEGLAQTLQHEGDLAPETVKAREIALNGLDARHRELEFGGAVEAGLENLPARVAIAEVVGAYEGLGNHLYRCVDPMRRLIANPYGNAGADRPAAH